MVGRVVQQPATDDLLLAGSKFGRSAGGWSRCQACRAVVVESGEPATHAAGIDAKEVGDIPSAIIALNDALDGQTPPALKFSRGSFLSPTSYCCNWQANRALLS